MLNVDIMLAADTAPGDVVCLNRHGPACLSALLDVVEIDKDYPWPYLLVQNLNEHDPYVETDCLPLLVVGIVSGYVWIDAVADY